MKSALHFLLGLPGALALTAVINEAFPFVDLIRDIALRFRAISDAFWRAVFDLLRIRIEFDPDVLTTYALMLLPLLVQWILAVRRVPATDGVPQPDESRKPAHGIYWYCLGLVCAVAIMYGFDTLRYVGDALYVALATMGNLFLIGLKALLIIVPLFLLSTALFGVRGVIALQVTGWIIAVLILVSSVTGWGLFQRLRDASPTYLQGFFDYYLTAYSLDTWLNVYFGIFTFLVIVLSPLSRAPTYIVSWVALFFGADFFARRVEPALRSWLDTLPAGGS